MQNSNPSFETYDRNMLIKNIRMHMKHIGMTQQDLADILLLDQPGISKRLSTKENVYFTLDQIILMARHFSTTVDSLLGLTPPEDKKTDIPSPLEICKFLVKLFETFQIQAVPATYEETIFEYRRDTDAPYGGEFRAGPPVTKEYLAFIFPNHDDPLDAYSEDEFMANLQIFGQIGNESKNAPINDFLVKYLDAFQNYKNQKYSKEKYETLVSAYYKLLV